MSRGLLILLIGGAALALGCSSDDEEVERELVHHGTFPVALEALAGTYELAAEPQDDPPRSREIDFEISDRVEDFRSLRLVVEGSWTSGQMEVAYEFPGGIVFYDMLAIVGRLQFDLTIPGDPEKIYHAVVGPFGDDFSAHGDVQADWLGGSVNAEDLAGVPLEATLSCDRALGDEERMVEPSTGVLTAVRLELLGADVYEKGAHAEGPVGVH